MFEIGGTELLLIAVVALIVIGPKELPNALRTVGRYTGKARAMTRHLRSGFDEMMRQAELEEMEKQWAEHNRKIMAEFPTLEGAETPPRQGEVADSDGGVSPSETAPQDPLPPHEAGATPQDSLPPHGGRAGERGGATPTDIPAEPLTPPPADRPLP